MAASSVAVAKPPVPEIVERYLRGELAELAAESKVAQRTLYSWMLAGLGDEAYHDLVTQALVSRVADADVKLEAAANMFEVQKAKEIGRFARFDLERRRPALYGPKQEVKHTGAPTLRIVLLERPSSGEVFENGGALPAPVVEGAAASAGGGDNGREVIHEKG